jgi:tripartite-type tricarboxylate transporter receptor subunit TctC
LNAFKPEWLAACTALILGLAGLPVHAQVSAFPSKPVRITSPFPTGLAVDVSIRLIAERLSRSWGQQVIVDARPGGNGLIAIGAVKKAPADGHDLLVVANSYMTINPNLIKGLPYDPEKDFAPVSLVSRAPFFVVASATGPYKSLQDLIAAAKTNPGRVTYSSPGVGSAPHIGGALLAYLSGTQMTAVHFKDSAPMFTSIVNGDVSFIVSTVGSAAPLIKAGKLRYIAAASPARLTWNPAYRPARKGRPARLRSQHLDRNRGPARYAGRHRAPHQRGYRHGSGRARHAGPFPQPRVPIRSDHPGRNGRAHTQGAGALRRTR